MHYWQRVYMLSGLRSHIAQILFCACASQGRSADMQLCGYLAVGNTVH